MRCPIKQDMEQTAEIKKLKNDIRRLKNRIAELERTEEELKRAKHELIKKEKKFRDLVELLPQTVYEMDLQGNFKFTNNYGIKSFGYTQEDINYLSLKKENVLKIISNRFLMAPNSRAMNILLSGKTAAHSRRYFIQAQ